MKPRIIITMHYLELGGAEMALIGLLNALDPTRVDVDLFIYSHQGPLMKYIPEWVNLLPEIKSYSLLERPIQHVFLNCKLQIAGARLWGIHRYKQYMKRINHKDDELYLHSLMQYISNSVTPLLPKINREVEYDVCISFLTPHNIGLDKVRAKKRLAWIHTDYSTICLNDELELPVWEGYDYIAAISENVRESFLKIFPTLKSKIIDIENILPTEYIKKKSEEFDASGELKGALTLLSIGRFVTAKNYDNVPEIASKIIEKGISDLKWYIIGYGLDEQLIRNKISEFAMEDHVIILGKKENPYPYIKACDIYVQPSRYEGKSITVREAQTLGKPVAITDYATAPSQIRDGIDGVIVPLDNAGCAEGLSQFINNTDLRKSVSDYCLTHDFGNESEVEKIYALLYEQ